MPSIRALVRPISCIPAVKHAAAALAFNGAVTPHAADFGYGIMELGSMAQIGAGIGRSMSPVAGAGIIVAGIAGINPMEMAKRNAVPCIIATVVIMLLLL